MIETADLYIWMALKERLQVAWDGLFAWPTETFVPGEAPYLAPQLLQGRAVKPTIADPGSDRTGVLLIRYVVQIGSQTQSEILYHAGRVAGFFASGLRLKYEDLCLRIDEDPEVIGGYRDGGYWHTPIRVKWRTYA